MRSGRASGRWLRPETGSRRPGGAVGPGAERLRAVAALVVTLGVLLGGCKGDGRPASGTAGAAGARRYTVRGEIVRLPAQGAAELTVRHEPIDDFADASGKVVGMDSMTMSFPLAPSASAKGLSVGDAVELRLAVDWAKPSLEVEQVTRLPPGTALSFREARRRPRRAAPGRGRPARRAAPAPRPSPAAASTRPCPRPGPSCRR